MDYFDWYAAYLHRTCPVVDAHLDLVTEVYRRRLTGEKGILRKYYKNEFQKSGVNLVFASLFLGEDELEACKEGGVFLKGAVLKKTLEMLAAFYADMEEAKGRIQLVRDGESLRRITAKRSLSRHHKVGILLYLEGLDMLEGEPELLRCFYAMGVRGAALTWNKRRELENGFATGCFCGEEVLAEGDFRGEGRQAITDKGVQVLNLMEKLGIFVDSSHLSRQAARLLLSFTTKPYAATHSNAAALCNHPRNLTDEMIKETAGRGGVIGVNAYREFIKRRDGFRQESPDKAGGKRSGCGEENRSSITSVCGRQEVSPGALCDQIIYLMKTAGEDHTGLGLDLGEGNIFTGYKELQGVTAELLRRGCSVEAVKKLLGQNWIRFLLEVLN